MPTESADARELRRRLEAEAGSLDPRYTAAPDLMREAAAALERLEALEELLREATTDGPPETSDSYEEPTGIGPAAPTRPGCAGGADRRSRGGL